MYTPKNMDFHHFCGDMTESLDYIEDSNTPVSPIYKNNFVSFRLHPRNLPAYNSESQLLEAASIEDQLIQTNAMQRKYKCYKCYGMHRDFIQMNALENECSQCQGHEYLPETNGLARIFEQILKIKLPQLMQKKQQIEEAANCMNNVPKSRDFSFLFGSQKSIQEEESVSYQQEEQKQCKACSQVYQSSQMNCCTKCEDYFICQSCFASKCYEHPPNHQFGCRESHKMSIRYCRPQTMKKISQEFQSEQTSNCFDSTELQLLKCHYCNQLIEECYEACLECEKNGINIALCPQCSQIYPNHDANHSTEMRTVARASKLLELSSRPSGSQSELTQPTPSKKKSKVKSKNSIIAFPNFESEDFNNEGSANYDNANLGCSLFKENNADSNNLGESNRGSEYLFEGEDITHLLAKKKCKKIEESMVDIEMDHSIQIPYDKSQDFVPTMPSVSFSVVSNERVQPKDFQTNPQEYIFNDYQCDICKVCPIKNKRYHCKQCENFDLCEDCYQARAKRHQHKNYELIDGLEMIKKTRQSMMKVQTAKGRLSRSRISITRTRA